MRVSFRKDHLAIAALAACMTLVVFLRALGGGFVNLDDPIFVQNNPYIRQLNGELLSWAFSSRALDLLIPFTWISFALDYRLWGLNPLGFHLTNVLLHGANTALVAMIATAIPVGGAGADGQSRQRRAPLWVALLAALLFGIHPLRVESVAWITERKDVLNGLFSLSAVYWYLCFCRKRAANGGAREYLLALVLFGCSLLAKPVSVGLPLLFLVLDWFPLQRLSLLGWRTVIREKIPFLAISAIIGLLTIVLFSQKHLLVGLGRLSLADRCLLSGNALFEYCRLMLLPVGILPFYELPDTIGLPHVLKSLVVTAFTLVALLLARKRPWLLAGWLCFLLPVIPVLAFLQNNDVAFAARYTYLPSVAPSLLAAFGAAALLDRFPRDAARLRQSVFLGLVAVLLWYGGITYRLIGVWHDTASLWTRVIALNPATTKYMDRGVYYLLHDNPAAASADFSAAIGWLAARSKTPDHNAYAFRGVAEMDLKRFDAALLDFDAALALRSHPTYFYYRAMALQALGRQDEARIDFNRAGPNPPLIDTFP